MQKKILISVTIVLVISLVLIGMYMVDMHMMDNNKPVIFSTWGYDYAPPEIIGNAVNIVDKTKGNSQFTCDTALEKIFEDGKNIYYLSCIKSDYVVVKYENGYEEDVKEALKNGRIYIKELDRFNISYITQAKIKQFENSFVGTVIENSATHIIVRPNENESERKSSDKIVVNFGENVRDYYYVVGTKVVISYDGGIMETYPAMINESEISVLY